VFCSVAVRTVLAAAGGCSLVDRRASGACRWATTAVPASVGGLAIWPARWSAHSGPLSVAGSCRVSPDRQSQSTSTDRGRRAMMPGDGGRVGSPLLQRGAPVLGAPAAGVGRVHADDRDAAPGGHGGQPGAELAGGRCDARKSTRFPLRRNASQPPSQGRPLVWAASHRSLGPALTHRLPVR